VLEMRKVSAGKDNMARFSEKSLWKEHDAFGLVKFGKERWEKANIGWASGNRFICSKVYAIEKGQQTKVLTTEWIMGQKQPIHVITDYKPCL